jgi:hypothetical protein
MGIQRCSRSARLLANERRALVLSKLLTEDLLDRAALHIAKCPFAEKTYAGVCCPGMGICAKKCTSSQVCASQLLAGGFKHNADPGAPGLL